MNLDPFNIHILGVRSDMNIHIYYYTYNISSIVFSTHSFPSSTWERENCMLYQAGNSEPDEINNIFHRLKIKRFHPS